MQKRERDNDQNNSNNNDKNHRYHHHHRKNDKFRMHGSTDQHSNNHQNTSSGNNKHNQAPKPVIAWSWEEIKQRACARPNLVDGHRRTREILARRSNSAALLGGDEVEAEQNQQQLCTSSSSASENRSHSLDPAFCAIATKEEIFASLYRPNVAATIFNENGEFLACFRKDRKAWQTVQGGVDVGDSGSVNNNSSQQNQIPSSQACPLWPQMDRSCRPPDYLLAAAVREIAEEIGLDPARDGLVCLGEVLPPAQRSGESSASSPSPQEPAAADFSFYRYEMPKFAGARIRAEGFIGQEQRQVLFFMPSRSIDNVQLIPDPVRFGPGVKQEFRRVEWKDIHTFCPLASTYKQHIICHTMSCDQTQQTIKAFHNQQQYSEKISSN